ncbi:MAG TPA: methyltransferase domain-containing protein [Allosphingosinicella sp.]|nr:methyltransferase domain-containing protein [Allosphingosinicella sp.]
MPVKASERIVSLYEDHAAAWDRLRSPGSLFEKPWLDRFLARVRPGGTILDIGCGSGQPIARYLIEQGFRLTGIDSAPSFIAMCRARFPEHQWEVADVRSLDLGRRFDGLIAWHSAFFHLTPEAQAPLFPRLAAQAAPGASLLFTSGPEHGELIGAWQSEPLYHGSLGPDEYRALLAANGFAAVEHRADDPDCGGATIWLASCPMPPAIP